MNQTKKFRCNGFCGEYECNQRQKEDPNICMRLNHRNPAVFDAMEETINTNYDLFKDLKD